MKNYENSQLSKFMEHVPPPKEVHLPGIYKVIRFLACVAVGYVATGVVHRTINLINIVDSLKKSGYGKVIENSDSLHSQKVEQV